MAATLEDTRPLRRQSPSAAAPGRGTTLLEIAAVLASPVILYVVLRLRGMSPPQLPDPSMHTTFILDPHEIFSRYQALFTPTARLREAARVGFLVPARISYLLFGAVPGFFVFRYVLALVAIVPLYLLLKRLYGRWAGFLGIAVVMSSPVVITAWGTDYPDSAAVSYLTGGLAALALSWEAARGRRGWLIAAGCLLTMAVWSHGAAVPLVAVAVVVYVGVRLRRARSGLWRDVALLAASAIALTFLLAVCSAVLLGQFNFISPTLKSAKTLSAPASLAANHSSSWSWAPYDVYLLVPPAIVAAYFAVLARRRRGIGTTQLFIGLTGALQLAAFAYLQFISSFQALEMHFFSSTLWSSLTVLLAITLAELAQPLVGREAARRTLRWWIAHAAPCLLVLAVALAFEAAVKLGMPVPAMTWAPWGLLVGAIVILAAVLGRLVPLRLVAAGTVVAITAATLVLTVARQEGHGPLPGTVYDPIASYANALGGNDSVYVSRYTVLSELPGFVGPPAYKGEVLLTWEPRQQFGDLLGPMGIYHNAITWVSESFPVLTPGGVNKITGWRAAQVLLMSLTGAHLAEAARSLAPFGPVVVRRGVLSDGSYHLHVWLIDLRRYLHARPA